MAEDWRVHVVVSAEGGFGPWAEDRVEARELAEDVGRALGDRVAVSRDDNELFLYTDTEEAARAADEVVAGDLQQHQWQASVTVERWHEDAGDWMSPDAPLPSS